MTLALLLAMVAFMVWACVHTNGRIHWWADEREAEALVRELRGELAEDFDQRDLDRRLYPLAFPDDVVAVAMLDGPLPEGTWRPDRRPA